MNETDSIHFTPVPLRARRDGWAPDLQRRFVKRLAQHGCVARAAREVGKTKQTAYALRERAGAESFRAAWDVALEAGRRRRWASAGPSWTERARDGWMEPILYRGRKVGERRRYDDRALAILLGRCSSRAEDEAPVGRSGRDGP